jgi:hypothetical protein
MSDQLDIQRLREAVAREMAESRRRSRIGLFIGHLVISIVFNLNIIIAALTNEPFRKLLMEPDSPLAILIVFPILLGFLGPLFHGLSLFGRFNGLSSRRRTEAIMRALGSELLDENYDLDDYAGSQKRKRQQRNQAVRLSDDGELVDADEINDTLNQVLSKRSES